MTPRTATRPDPGPIVLLGGLSDIGTQLTLRLARETANDPRTFVLAARRTGEPHRARTLAARAEDLRRAGAAQVEIREFDADDTGAHADFFARIAADLGTPGVTVLAFGVLGDAVRAQSDPDYAAGILHTDFVAQAAVLTALTALLVSAPASRGRRGSVVVFSSVAGIRVRRANYVYGAAKAGLDAYAGGLADALSGTGVHLLLARPGFVVGAMTRSLMESGTKPAPMSSTPRQVADAVADALLRRRRVVWIPGRLRLVFAVARMVPPTIWRRLPR